MRKKSIRRKKPLHHQVINNPLFIGSFLILVVVTGFVATKIFAAKPVQQTGQFELVDINANGEIANSNARGISMTKDGNFVVFRSDATNLGVTTGKEQLFLRDRSGGTTELVSILPDGSQIADNNLGSGFLGSISSDGQYMAFSHNGSIFVRDRNTQVTNEIPIGGNIFLYYMSPDGRYFSYSSRSGGLTSCYLYDKQENINDTISVSSDEVSGDRDATCGTVTDDGRYVVFTSSATNLVLNDTNNISDVFVRDRVAGETTFLYPPLGHTEGANSPKITSNGRFVVFESSSSNLVSRDTNGTNDVFLVDRTANTIERVSVTNSGQETTFSEPSNQGRISDDGRYVVFASQAPNLNPYRQALFSVYLRDRSLGQTEIIGQNPNCKQVLSSADAPSVSNDGRYVTLTSFTEGVVALDTNGFGDTFVRDRSIPFGRLAKHCN